MQDFTTSTQSTQVPGEYFKPSNHPINYLLLQMNNQGATVEAGYQEMPQPISQPIYLNQVTINNQNGPISAPIPKKIKFIYQFTENNKFINKAPINLTDESYQLNDSNKYFYGILLQLCNDLELEVQSFNILDLKFYETQKTISLNVKSKEDLEALSIQNKTLKSLLIQDLFLLIDYQDYLNKNEAEFVFNIEIESKQ